jgi:integrase
VASLCKKCRCGRDQWDSCDHVWLIRYRKGSGKEQYLSVGQNRRAAERRLADLERVRHETVTEAIEVWLAAKRRDPEARTGSLLTWESRATTVSESLGDFPVRDVRPGDLTDFARQLLESGRTPATCRAIYSLLTAVLRHAAARGVIHQLPLPPQGSGIPGYRGRRHDVTVGQLLVVIEKLDEPWNHVALLCLLTGLRIGEALALTNDDVGEGFLHVRRTRNMRGGVNRPKTRTSERVVPLTERAQLVLQDLDLPLVGTYSQARHALRAALGDLYVKNMSWHVFRNAHATLLDQDGLGLREVAARLGHGHNYAQSLQYSLVRELGPAGNLDELLTRHAAPPASEEPAQPVADLAAARARRRGRQAGP